MTKQASLNGVIALIIALAVGMPSLRAQELSLSAEDMQYDAQGASITLDGDASDWADAEFKSQIPFEQGGELVLFEEYGGGTWSGPADHSSAVAFAWDASNLYIGVVVTDDTHQNGGSGWNGDSIQMVFANAAQDTVTHLYNYGLSDGGDVVIHNEKGPGGSEASITRDDDTATTLYEFAFPAASLGLDGYESGMSIGVGLCVNDGDTQDGQSGQKGWSGWGPYAAVYGKTASATGLVNLVGEPGGAPSPPAPDHGWVFSEQDGETAGPAFGGAAGTLSGGVVWSTEDPLGGGGSVSFDGSDGTVVMEDLAEAFNGLSNFSLSIWIKANDTGIDKGFWEAVDSGGGDLWGLRYDSVGYTAKGSDVIKLGITTSESGGDTNRGVDQQETHEGTQTTEWQHIVMTWEDGVGFNLYIDGELDEPTLAMENTAGTLALMDRFVLGDGAKGYWDGHIDEVAVWASTLTAENAAWLAKNSIASLGAGGGDGPALSIVNNGDGTVTVTFEGTLQSADSVNGPWSDVDAASPLTIPADEAAQFGRAKN